MTIHAIGCHEQPHQRDRADHDQHDHDDAQDRARRPEPSPCVVSGRRTALSVPQVASCVAARRTGALRSTFDGGLSTPAPAAGLRRGYPCSRTGRRLELARELRDDPGRLAVERHLREAPRSSPRRGSAARGGRAPCRGRSAGRRRRTPGARGCASRRSGPAPRSASSSRLEDEYQSATLSPLVIGQPPSSVSFVAVRRKWANAGNIRSASSTALGTSDGSSISSCALVGVVHQRAHRARVRGLRGVVAGGHQQDEAGEDLVVGEHVAVDLGEDEHAEHVVGRVGRGGRRPAPCTSRASAGARSVLICSRPSGLRSGSPNADQRVDRHRPRLVVLGVEAHEAADHARDDRLRDFGDEVARLAALEPVHHAVGDLADRGLVLGDRLRREAFWNSALSRSCFGGSIPMNIRWMNSTGTWCRSAGCCAPRSRSPSRG